MVILVSDTSVLIDLERGALLERVFSCGLTMAVPDLLYEKELASYNGPYLQKLGLGVTVLSPTELGLAQTIKNERSALSLSDCFALSCSLRPNHALLTGDRNLRAEAEMRNAQVYGLLWLLDQLEASGQIPASALHDGLSKIAAHERCRLPKDEVKTRLDRWAARSG